MNNTLIDIKINIKTEKIELDNEVVKQKICTKCQKKTDILYGPTEWGEVCSTCLLQVASKEHRKDFTPIAADKYKF